MTDIYTQWQQQFVLDADKMIEMFTFAKGWEGKYRQIMLLGKQLPALPEADKDKQYLVEGCESQVWLHHKQDDDGRYLFAADADARIVKGLLVIVIAAFNGKSAIEIAQFDVEQYFARLDLLKHLSPSRSNGIHAIVQQIKELGCLV